MRAEDQFHTGIVVEDVDATLKELTALFGYEWCDEYVGRSSVTLAGGPTEVPMRLAYSKDTPRIEIIEAVPGTVWMPVAGSGIHHLGYWSDDIAADSAALASRGMPLEATSAAPDGMVLFVYHHGGTGPRVELVNRLVQPTMEQWWATGTFPG